MTLRKWIACTGIIAAALALLCCVIVGIHERAHPDALIYLNDPNCHFTTERVEEVSRAPIGPRITIGHPAVITIDDGGWWTRELPALELAVFHLAYHPATISYRITGRVPPDLDSNHYTRVIQTFNYYRLIGSCTEQGAAISVNVAATMPTGNPYFYDKYLRNPDGSYPSLQ